jgi:hypothetical protein
MYYLLESAPESVRHILLLNSTVITSQLDGLRQPTNLQLQAKCPGRACVLTEGRTGRRRRGQRRAGRPGQSSRGHRTWLSRQLVTGRKHWCMRSVERPAGTSGTRGTEMLHWQWQAPLEVLSRQLASRYVLRFTVRETRRQATTYGDPAEILYSVQVEWLMQSAECKLIATR